MLTNKSNKGRNNILNGYIPDEKQQFQLKLLLELTKACTSQNINIVIFGGYGLDGLYGKLTRNHDDLDLFVLDNSLNEFEKLLIKLGYQLLSKEIDKYVYVYPMLETKFKIEFAPTSLLLKFTDKPFEFFMPVAENASLNGQHFKVVTLQGQKEVIKIQNLRAKTTKWNDYPIDKRNNQNELIEILEESKSHE